MYTYRVEFLLIAAAAVTMENGPNITLHVAIVAHSISLIYPCKAELGFYSID